MSAEDELLAAKSKAALEAAKLKVEAEGTETHVKAWIVANTEPAAAIALVFLLLGGVLGHFIR